MTKDDVRARIEEIGIIPAIRVASTQDAHFAAEEIASAGIPIVELTMTVPGAIELIPDLLDHQSGVIVGAGTVLDIETARRCLDAGANFLTSPGLDLGVVEFAVSKGVVVLPGALTPTEVMMASKAGADFVKVFPCIHLGAARYIKALKGPFPHVPLIAAGGVNQENAAEFITAGAIALGIGGALIPHESIERRQPHRIHELARRFTAIVAGARARSAASQPSH
ncbi:MAG TPA: bifunctional 4-hydroxy-2-oxoglutarate aldolase/2-dehydro-3-deoxy-phosphogluconate aldolase [Bryobacteraceae bacterium]|jgi:2-dehydro-3-deoxyphosphogluconate aldolase/(4S)-4-hydroxy-2-oxoglutarate aldolase|nr:bifunctional 4-hydroxy-2-oxoglutarate aldolase/2-dehydro-3-deoxy-phosphogluconate aldolase [Bryobacteraceae bacterium]